MRSFNISVQGASHIKKNKECQDSSCSYCDDKITVAVVCDGHGGDDYFRSAFGSKYACEAALDNIRSFTEKIDKNKLEKNHDKLIRQLEASIINDWNEKIKSHYEQNPFTEEELYIVSEKARNKYLNNKKIESAYGTTLIAAAVTADYWFAIQIGDGKCVAVNPQGNFLQPIPWDDKCFLNATTSMCDSKALENFRHFYHAERLPVAVFIGSDGIDDCFRNNNQLVHLYKTTLYSFSTTDFDTAVNDLNEYLPRLSAKGSGDDVSIAAILDMDKIGELEAVKQFDREKEKNRIEENARLEAEKAAEEGKRIEEEYKKHWLEEERRKYADGMSKDWQKNQFQKYRMDNIDKLKQENDLQYKKLMEYIDGSKPTDQLEREDELNPKDWSEREEKPRPKNELEREDKLKPEDGSEREDKPKPKDELDCENKLKPEDGSEREEKPRSKNELEREDKLKPEDGSEREDKLKPEDEPECEDKLKPEDGSECEDKPRPKDELNCDDKLESKDKSNPRRDKEQSGGYVPRGSTFSSNIHENVESEKRRENQPGKFKEQTYVRTCEKCGKKIVGAADKYCCNCGNKLFRDINTRI